MDEHADDLRDPSRVLSRLSQSAKFIVDAGHEAHRVRGVSRFKIAHVADLAGMSHNGVRWSFDAPLLSRACLAEVLSSYPAAFGALHCNLEHGLSRWFGHLGRLHLLDQSPSLHHYRWCQGSPEYNSVLRLIDQFLDQPAALLASRLLLSFLDRCQRANTHRDEGGMLDLQRGVAKVMLSGLWGASIPIPMSNFAPPAHCSLDPELREQILTAGAALVAGRSLQGVTIEATVAKAGTRTGKYRELFPSFPDFLQEAIAYGYRPLQIAFEADRKESAGKRLVRQIVELAYLSQAGRLYVDLDLLKGFPPQLRDRLVAEVAQFERGLRRTIDKASLDGWIKSLPSSMTVELCWGVIEGAYGLKLDEVAPYLGGFFNGPHCRLQ